MTDCNLASSMRLAGVEKVMFSLTVPDLTQAACGTKLTGPPKVTLPFSRRISLMRPMKSAVLPEPTLPTTQTRAPAWSATCSIQACLDIKRTSRDVKTDVT